MSVSTNATTARGRLPLGSPPRLGASLVFRGFVFAIIVSDLALLGTGSVLEADRFRAAGLDLVGWAVCTALMGLVSIQTDSGPQLGMDMPLLLSVGFLHGPIVAGAVTFVSFLDPRELRGAIGVTRALFNRAQTSLSVMSASGAFVLLGGETGDFPRAGFAALIAVGVDAFANYGLVIGVMVLHERSSVAACLRRLRLGGSWDFVVTYLSFGLLSLLLAEVYLSVGQWGLVLFVLPTLLARKALWGSHALQGANARIRMQGQAIAEASSRVADERRDERLAIAAGLHDDVLPPLFKVHLMGRVLGQDLATGHLLALEDDVPELIRATDQASEAMRTVIKNLRESPLGSKGLADTLRLLARHLEGLYPRVRIVLDVDETDGTPLVQLLTYQVAREALRNALHHSHAETVRVSLHDDGDDLRLLVVDDGVGFEFNSVDQDRHFGLGLIRERVELAGGILQVDSQPGAGTCIIVRLPRGRGSG